MPGFFAANFIILLVFAVADDTMAISNLANHKYARENTIRLT